MPYAVSGHLIVFARPRLIEISHQVKGSIHNGQYERVNAVKPGSCPSKGIKYVPKVEDEAVRGRGADL